MVTKKGSVEYPEAQALRGLSRSGSLPYFILDSYLVFEFFACSFLNIATIGISKELYFLKTIIIELCLILIGEEQILWKFIER